jgi:enamine deaminase RidA (YjgF/YER057c/UK114 family)
MLEAVGSDLEHVVHVNIFLKRMSDFESMNATYVDKMAAIARPGPLSASANSRSRVCSSP